MSTTIVLSNDWHFSVRPPVSRVDDYNGELFGLLDQIERVARRVDAKAVCIAGDMLHGGSLPYPTLNRLLDWASSVRRAGIHVLAIPGNHDLKHDRYESKDTLPVGALFTSGLFVDVSRSEFDIGGVSVWGVPWPDGGQPHAFSGTIPSTVDVVLAHGFATPEGVSVYGDHYHAYEDLAVGAPHVRLWHFGHDHSDHGVATLSNGAKVVNIGALSRGAHDKDNITRDVKIAIATIPARPAPVTVQQVKLKYTPADQIFDFALRARKVQERQQVEQFVAQLKDGLAAVSTVDFAQALQAADLSDEVRNCALQYIDRAEATV